jgi:transposase
MANELKMEQHQAIIGLWRQGWSYRRIAAELHIDRETVSRHVKAVGGLAGPGPTGPPAPDRSNATILIAGSDGGHLCPSEAGGGAGAAATGSNATIPITGSGGGHLCPAEAGGGTAAEATESNAAIPIAGSNGDHLNSAGAGSTALEEGNWGDCSAGRRSRCGSFRALIIEGLEKGLTAQRIWQDLRDVHEFTGGYLSVQRFVRRLRESTPLPFRRMECEPGAEAQIDFGKGAPVVKAQGKRSRPHLFRMVLSHSRKAYSEVVPRQTTELFLRCIENAFWYFGGVPRTLVPDNLKAAVLNADWFDPELNPKIVAFCEHYGTVLLPTRPRTPRHKGKVERAVGYAQSNAVKGRTFASLAEQNAFLREWESSIADTRIHGTTRQQVAAAFAREKPALLPLPAGRFPCFQEARRIVNRDGHVEVAKAYYSAPPEFVGRTLWARWDVQTVRLFDEHFKQVAIHARREPGQFATAASHIAPAKRSGLERGAASWLASAHRIGAHAGEWGQAVLQQRGVPGTRVLMGLVSLTRTYPAHAVDRACRVAASHGAYHLRDVSNLLKRSEPAAEQQMLPFIDEHEVIRPLSEYGKLIETAFDQTPVTKSSM